MSGYEFVGEVQSDLHVCSIESLRDSLFLCGAYELQEGGELGEENAVPSRLGSLTLYDAAATLAKYESEESKVAAPIVKVGAYETNGGVLDCKVAHGGTMVAAALSTGRLQLFSFDKEANEAAKAHLALSGEVCFEEEGLFLSVDWSTGPHALDTNTDTSAPPTQIVTSTQQSSLMVFDVNMLLSHTESESESVFASSASVCEPLVHIADAHSLMGETVPAWIVVYDVGIMLYYSCCDLSVPVSLIHLLLPACIL
jgi:hypothetical protein